MLIQIASTNTKPPPTNHRQTIPLVKGKKNNYKNIARKLNNPRAYRAVANANAANPIPIIIPCHRVIQSNGDLGNYGGGRELKQSLVQLETDNSFF